MPCFRSVRAGRPPEAGLLACVASAQVPCGFGRPIPLQPRKELCRGQARRADQQAAGQQHQPDAAGKRIQQRAAQQLAHRLGAQRDGVDKGHHLAGQVPGRALLDERHRTDGKHPRRQLAPAEGRQQYQIPAHNADRQQERRPGRQQAQPGRRHQPVHPPPAAACRPAGRPPHCRRWPPRPWRSQPRRTAAPKAPAPCAPGRESPPTPGRPAPC